jgi:hypothetical protein
MAPACQPSRERVELLRALNSDTRNPPTKVSKIATGAAAMSFHRLLFEATSGT